MKEKSGIYVGDGKVFYKIQKLIENSNIDINSKKFIIDEFEKISLSAQILHDSVENMDCEYRRLRDDCNFINK